MKITINFTALLTAIFITLKLYKVITWSWWWVLSPIWIPPAIALTTLLIASVLSVFFLIILFLIGILVEKSKKPLDN